MKNQNTTDEAATTRIECDVLLACPLCGAGNESGEVNVHFTPRVWGSISARPETSEDSPPNHWFNGCQMVRCNVCGCMVIDPQNARKLWNENRGRYSR